MMRLATLALVGLLSASVAAGAATTPLVDAVKAADRTAIRSLLQRGVDVNAAAADGTSPLHWAAHNGDLSTVNALIRARAQVNVKNRYGVAPIWLAATNGHADVVDALLVAGADAQTTRADSGETVLMIAAMAGHAPVVQRLLAHGADPNAKDAVRTQTALMWAAAERHADVVRILVEAGASVEARSSTEMTPLMFAIRAGSIDATLLLLDVGAKVDATAPDGTTMLGLAIINAHWELAARLLDRGADANAKDPRGRPLQMVAFMRRAENRGLSAWLPRKPTGNLDSIGLAKALLAHGARIDDQLDYANPNYGPTHMALGGAGTTWVGATSLYIAAKNCDVEFVRFLAAQGANPSMPNAAGVTPLLAAAGVGYTLGESPGTPEEALDTVKVLTELGNDLRATAGATPAKVDAPLTAASTRIRPGWNGAGAIHGAVIRGAEGLVTWLISQGLPLDLTTAEGATPLDLARGSSLGITFHVQPQLAERIERAMRAKGLPVPEHHYTGANPIN